MQHLHCVKCNTFIVTLIQGTTSTPQQLPRYSTSDVSYGSSAESYAVATLDRKKKGFTLDLTISILSLYIEWIPHIDQVGLIQKSNVSQNNVIPFSLSPYVKNWISSFEFHIVATTEYLENNIVYFASSRWKETPTKTGGTLTCICFCKDT